MYIGVDYYPEHWPKEMIEEDIRRMGVKTVRRWGQMAIWNCLYRQHAILMENVFEEVN
ncbi:MULTISPECIES: hypothetical protein [Anoxybacillus]|uniref:Uncharacterized protein n=1 Tax=Anoxybacillus flavithermus TaxID=33934 RepID=A0A178TLT5_9BACL|nr:hypothetical protein [Anoxybacillus flavithermus]ELK22747.1 beta galactosidase [Anoxybacillus flavithermus TNO-09.006]MBE2904965.1 hypothetical protein [Anoxybacillus flavithermus]MBE2908147.1 hypothetical protein [Anoxybacillus flavithermus]MBE2911112.1 hypothetical protein [Anoxybacillus flavithermus]MBE2912021.1 hypothetical protein [Anoxybacillus flavithermus]